LLEILRFAPLSQATQTNNEVYDREIIVITNNFIYMALFICLIPPELRSRRACFKRLRQLRIILLIGRFVSVCEP